MLGIGRDELFAGAVGEEFLQFVHDLGLDHVLNLVGVVMDVLRCDIGVLKEVSFPEAMVAGDATRLDFALR